jgi:hypothetical protein
MSRNEVREISFSKNCSGKSFKITFGKKIIKKGKLPKSASAKLEIELPPLEWSPNCPNLYKVAVFDKNKQIEAKNVGFRKLSCSEKHIMLNNTPVYIRGAIRGIRAHEHINLQNLSETEFHKKYIQKAKSLGFNLIRWHSSIPPKKFMELSDELGMLNQIEFAPEYSFKNGKKEFTLNLKHVEKIAREYGEHPSAFSFCLGNEIHNSGGSTLIKDAVAAIKRGCPHTLILDNCGWGEADRQGTDYLCQHIAYFFPMFKHKDMFDSYDCFNLDGSIKNVEIEKETKTSSAKIKAKRCLIPNKPTLSHETFHYISLPDIKRMKKKHKKHSTEEPWWIDEIADIAKEKGLAKDYENLRKASEHFKMVCLKETFENLRKSHWLQGYEMLQLADTDRYENPNGLLDYFDDEKKIFCNMYKQLNTDFAVAANFRKKCFQYNEDINIELYASNFATGITHVDFDITVRACTTKSSQKLSYKNVYAAKTGANKVLNLSLNLKGKKAQKYTMSLKAKSEGKVVATNSWDFWLFPASSFTYEKLNADKNVITKIGKKEIEKLKKGERLLFIYDGSTTVKNAGIPLTEDIFKPVIWDRGHQLGAIIRKHKIFDAFPNEGVMDMQFANLVQRGIKANLDNISEITPVMQGIDKATRDRMDGLIHGNTTFQRQSTLRRFGYVFEVKVGKGKLLVSTFNLSKDNFKNIEVSNFAENLYSYFKSSAFKPSDSLSFQRLTEINKAAKKQTKESVMNTYWLEDLYPVETTLWWEKAGVDITKFKH